MHFDSFLIDSGSADFIRSEHFPKGDVLVGGFFHGFFEFEEFHVEVVESIDVYRFFLVFDAVFFLYFAFDNSQVVVV